MYVQLEIIAKLAGAEIQLKSVKAGKSFHSPHQMLVTQTDTSTQTSGLCNESSLGSGNHCFRRLLFSY